MTEATSGAPAPAQHLGRSGLFERLARLGISTRTVEHPAVHTVAESSAIEIALPGAHTKNLFLKDEDGRLVLVVAESSTRVDIKGLAKKLETGRLSFGKPDLMMEVLGVTPGSVTAFAIVNDTQQRVQIVIDDALTRHDSLNCHPMENTATTNIALGDLLSFIRSTGHEPRVMIVSAS